MPSKPGFTDTLCALTTRIFRCHGLAPSSERHDQVGGRDFAFWLALAAVGAAWYFLLFQPTRERNAMLAGRLTVLQAQWRAEHIEQARLRREIQALARGEAGAWERAARVQLGWLQPGEVTNREVWRREHPQWAGLVQAPPAPRASARPVLTMKLYPAPPPPSPRPLVARAPAPAAGARLTEATPCAARRGGAPANRLTAGSFQMPLRPVLAPGGSAPPGSAAGPVPAASARRP
jgi:hypothetical protein